MSTQEFFECLGYLAAPQRHTRIDVELPERSREGFENRYEQITGERPIQDGRFYYVWSDDANKWGVEMRLYFIENQNIPPCLINMRRSSTYYRDEYKQYNARINNNEFIWQLIEYGFGLGDSQDLNLIRSRVPSQYISDFNRGLSN